MSYHWCVSFVYEGRWWSLHPNQFTPDFGCHDNRVNTELGLCKDRIVVRSQAHDNMARLTQQRGNPTKTQQEAADMASSTRARQGPDKAGASHRPSLKPKERPVATATDFQIRARQQRSLRLPHVDSLLLHPIANSISRAPPPKEQDIQEDEHAASSRRSPTRKAKTKTSSLYAQQLANVLEDEIAASDWEQNSELSEADDSVCSDEHVFTFATPTKSVLPSLKVPSFASNNSRRPLDVIDLTSPVRNAQIPILAPSGRIQVTKVERPTSSSDAEPAATLRL